MWKFLLKSVAFTGPEEWIFSYKQMIGTVLQVKKYNLSTQGGEKEEIPQWDELQSLLFLECPGKKTNPKTICTDYWISGIITSSRKSIGLL